MAAIDVINRVLREFRRYTGDGLPNEPLNAPLPEGDPSSGRHSPMKSDLREAMIAPIEESNAAADRAEQALADALAMIVPDNGVTTPKIVTGAVTTPKLADGAITADKISDDPDEIDAINAKIGNDWAKPEVGPRGGTMALERGRSIFLGDDSQTIVNQQELAAWYKALNTTYASALSTGVVGTNYLYMMGDSKVAGVGQDADYTYAALLLRQARKDGVMGVNTAAYGWGGVDSGDLLSNAVPGQGIEYIMGGGGFPTCNLFIFNFGTNEQVTPALSLNQTDTNVRALIDRLRNTGASPAGRTASQMSIMIMGQTTGNNDLPAYGQTQGLMRELNSLYRDIAVDKNVAFYDPYAHFPRPHKDAGWQDEPFTGKYVHMGNEFMMAVVSELVELVFPRSLVAKIGTGENTSFDLPWSAGNLPSAYPFGRSMHRATTASSWPFDGIVVTERHPSRVTVQTNYDRSTSQARIRTSPGATDAWNAWSSNI